MKTQTILLTAIFLLSPLVLSKKKKEPLDKAAIKSARVWLKHLDRGDYEKTYQMSASHFREKVTLKIWKDSAMKARKPFGPVQQRKLLGKKPYKELPNAPKADYVVIQFKTRFQNREGVETVTPMKDRDGKWRVSGYYIR